MILTCMHESRVLAPPLESHGAPALPLGIVVVVALQLLLLLLLLQLLLKLLLGQADAPAQTRAGASRREHTLKRSILLGACLRLNHLCK